MANQAQACFTDIVPCKCSVAHGPVFERLCAPENHRVHKVFFPFFSNYLIFYYSRCFFLVKNAVLKQPFKLKSPSLFIIFILLPPQTWKTQITVDWNKETSHKTRPPEAAAIKTLNWRLHKAAAATFNSFTRWTATKVLGFFFFTYFLWGKCRFVCLDWLPVRLAQPPPELHFPHPRPTSFFSLQQLDLGDIVTEYGPDWQWKKWRAAPASGDITQQKQLQTFPTTYYPFSFSSCLTLSLCLSRRTQQRDRGPTAESQCTNTKKDTSMIKEKKGESCTHSKNAADVSGIVTKKICF